MSTSWVLAVLLLALGIAPAFAQDPTADLDSLRAAVQQEDEQRKRPAANMEYDGGPAMGQLAVLQLQRSLRSTDPSQVEQAVSVFAARYTSAPVREALARLQAVLKTQREARQKKQAEEIDAALAAVRTAIANAKAPADLDGALVALDKAAERTQEGVSDYRQERSQKLRAAREFVTYWQDYLAFAAAGNSDRAIQSLENISRNQSADLLPRSAVLERIEALRPPKDVQASKIEAIIQGCRMLEEIPQALAQVDALPRPQDTSNSLQQAIQFELVRIRDAYADYKLGLPVLFDLRSDGGSGVPRNADAIRLVQALKTQLLRLIVPRFLRAEGSFRADETVEAFLNRMTTTALDKVDARLMSRVVEVRAKLAGSSNSAAMPPALQALLAGQNQEEAAQYVPAVISYQKALSVGGELVPAKIIGTRLEAIKAAHPTDYEAGLKISLSAPPPSNSPYSTGAQGPYYIAVPAAPTSSPP